MASPLATKGVAIACLCGMALAASGMASAVPGSKRDQQRKSVHGTAVQTQTGRKDIEQGMSSMDVRKVVQGKNQGDDYYAGEGDERRAVQQSIDEKEGR